MTTGSFNRPATYAKWARKRYYQQLAEASGIALNPTDPKSSYDPDEPGEFIGQIGVGTCDSDSGSCLRSSCFLRRGSTPRLFGRSQIC